MNLLASFSVLVAQYSRWKHLGSKFRRSSSGWELADFWPVLLLAIVAGVLAAVVVQVRRRRDLSLPCDDPQKLFRELAQAHGLDRASQKLLQQLAHVFQLATPAEVFVTPQVFQVDRLPPPLAQQAPQIAALRQRLF